MKVKRPLIWVPCLLALAALFSYLPLSVFAAESQSINAQVVSKLKSGGTIFLPISHEPSQFNPLHLDGNDPELSRMMSASLPELFLSDAAGKLSPNKDYIVSFTQTKKSPQTFAIVLNPKAMWSDGKKIGLADFTGMFRAFNGKNPNYEIVSSAGYRDIKSISQGKNSNEITIVMSKFYPDWQELFSPLLPASLTKDSASFNGGWRTKPLLSAGPFSFDGIDREQGSITWVRNNRWWGAKPNLEGITYRILPRESQLPALLNSELSYLDVTSDPNVIRQVRKNSDFLIHAVSHSEKWEQISINSKNPILSDITVRQALVLAVNRDALSQINTGLFVAAPSPKNNRIFAPNQLCFQDNSGSWNKQNVARADELLEQAGWIPANKSSELDSDGKNKVIGMRYYAGPARSGLLQNQRLALKYIYPNGNPIRENTAMLIQAMLRAKPIGIDLQLVEVPEEEYFKSFVNPSALNFDLAGFAWSSSTMPITGSLNLYLKSSSQNFSPDSISAKLDSLIKKTLVELDAKKRCAMANEVDQQLWSSAYNIPLYDWPAATVTTKSLANFGTFGLTSIDWTKIGFMK